MDNSKDIQLSKTRNQIALLESKCTLFGFTDYGSSNKIKINEDGYDFEFTLRFSANEQEKKATVGLNTKLFEKAKDSLRNQLAFLKSEFVFRVENFNELVIREGDKTEIKQALIHFCFTIALSTVRGMYNVKLENSLYSNAVLPIVQLSDLSITKESIE